MVRYRGHRGFSIPSSSAKKCTADRASYGVADGRLVHGCIRKGMETLHLYGVAFAWKGTEFMRGLSASMIRFLVFERDLYSKMLRENDQTETTGLTRYSTRWALKSLEYMSFCPFWCFHRCSFMPLPGPKCIPFNTKPSSITYILSRGKSDQGIDCTSMYVCTYVLCTTIYWISHKCCGIDCLKATVTTLLRYISAPLAPLVTWGKLDRIGSNG